MEAEDLREELTCSICLDYFEDPVSIECGHNFCRACLRRSWAQSSCSFSCPECRQPSGPGALRPNWALARLTDRTRRRCQLPVPSGLCRHHREPLRLFCEDDQRPVCLVCRESQEHQAHVMAPVDEASVSYREKLLMSQCSLTAKMKKAMQLQETEMKNTTKWKVQIKNQRTRISTEFSKLHQFLAEEELLFLQRLSEEEEETKSKLKDNMLRLNETIASLKNLMLEVGEKSQASTLELLQVRQAQERIISILILIEDMFSLLAVSVAEVTAHPKLVFSQEGRYVKNAASASSWSATWNYFVGWKNPLRTTDLVERFQHLPCVLGKNVFTSGKHYWEVENRGSLEIAVGVCQEDIMGITDSSSMSPHVGIWAIYWSSAGYRPLSRHPLTLPRQEPVLHRVGVYLDYEAGSVSFYSAEDGLLLHTFSCSFVSRLRPFFWLSPSASLVIPAMTSGK
ncbi:E3 ubiquitin-protein ligase TRIM4 [Otolemur garnettii]|uniref:E3 ubiquitin-protein ligase TRIM4 n=1 Tax=Otolemur garnettii TaxID=30611 RepID=UPI000C7EB2EE|nr:E3 ubiquitin-protein ligase TRIM4 [Otolemur garnettii]